MERHDRDAAALIDTLVQLGSSLSIKTLAEGIEDIAQLRVLQRAGCDLGQGFLFSRPVDAATVEELMCEQRSCLQAAGDELHESALALS